MIARVDVQTELEQIIDLLERYQAHASVAPVLRDIHEVQRLLDYYSFRTPQLADRFAEQLQGRYRYELFGLYGAAGTLSPRPESSYLYLQQMLGQLVRIVGSNNITHRFHSPNKPSANNLASKGCKSSIPSPTPIYFTGIPNSS